jgi:hypothetical protein
MCSKTRTRASDLFRAERPEVSGGVWLLQRSTVGNICAQQIDLRRAVLTTGRRADAYGNSTA